MTVLSARRLILTCTVAVAASVAVIVPGTASAASDLGKQCSGAPIKGNGSSFQAPILEKWGNDFNEISGIPNKNAKACGGSQGSKGKPKVEYTSGGSGACLHGWHIEGTETKYAEDPYCGTDEAPNEKQKGELEGQKAGGEGESLETIPVVQGAVAVIVHLPEGCKAKSEVEVTNKEKLKEKLKLGRLVLDNSSLEGIYKGSIRSWKKLLANQAKYTKDPGADALTCAGGTVSGKELAAIKYENEKGEEVTLPEGEAATAAEEAAEIITPVVRLDHSGTTHIFKAWLAQVNPTGKIEMETYPEIVGGKNTGCGGALAEAPETWGEVEALCQNQRWPTAAHIVRGTVTGNPGVVARVNEVQSTVGYADLAVAREKGFFSKKGEGGENALGEQNTKFWAEVQDSKVPTATGFSDPASNGDVEATQNSRCSGTKYTEEAGKKFPPVSTRKPWNAAKAELAETQYSICGLTYDLTLRQYGFYPGLDEVSEETLGKTEANTVHDFLLWALNGSKEGGGSLVAGSDYEKLPAAIIEEAEDGVEEIGYKLPGKEDAKEKT